MKAKKPAAVLLTAVFMAVVLLAAGVAALVVFLRQDADIYIPPRPEDTELEYWIGQDVTDVDWTGHACMPGFGVCAYLGEGYRPDGQGEWPTARVTYEVTAWPDYSDGGSYVTRIFITDPAVSVYGLTVNSDFRQFRRVMESKGYTVEAVNENTVRAARGGFIFSLTPGELLTVRAHVTNRRGIVF